MAQAIYLLCSRDGSLDRDTNLLSHFHVIDNLIIKATRIGSGEDRPTSKEILVDGMRVVGSWMRDDADEGREFEYFTSFRLPNSDDYAVPVQPRSFQFTHKFFRIIYNFQGMGPFSEAMEGLMWIEQGIRPKGDQDWLLQRYPIMVTIEQEVGSDDSSNG